MRNFFRVNKVIVFLTTVTLLGLFFYTYRLKETQLFRNDPARDTLKALQIWQNKELTIIGPPASFSLNTIREVYFGSLYLYIGILGLVIANWDPVGAVLPNTLLFTISIPFFYLITTKLTDSFPKRAVAVSLYTLSPITVTHARFFWNPNLIIPAAVFFWYLVLKAVRSKDIMINFFCAGIIAGLMFNFHYLVVIPLVVYIATLLFLKQFLKGFSILAGLIIGSLPIIIFELRNNFYLTQALLYGVSSGREPGGLNASEGIYHFFDIFWSILGFRQSEIDFPNFFQSNISNEVLLIATLIMAVLSVVRKVKQDQISRTFWPMVGVAIALTIYFSSGNPIRLRYLFSIYPIIIWLIVEFIWRLKARFVIILLFIPVIATSIAIITNKLSLEKNFLQLSLIENICKEVVSDNPAASYNITENLKGDARAMSFRYCITKGARYKPNDEYSYNNLTSLYVISPSIDKIYKDNRWEFYASGPWELMNVSDFGEVKLFKFVK